MAQPMLQPGASRTNRWRVSLVLSVAVLAISSSAVLVRRMEALPLAIAAWRTLGAAVVLSPALLLPRNVLSVRDALWLLLAGVALALHFWAWFTSVTLTTVLRCTVLVCLVPVWSAGLDYALWSLPTPRRLWIGLAVALPGLALLAGEGGSASLAGDALAVLSGLLWAVVLAIQGNVRQRVGTAATMAVECASAAVVLFGLGAATATPLTGWTAATWILLAAAVLGPQLLGHQGFAYALRWVSASTVATIALLEPVGASVLAAIVLGERPEPASVAGAVLVLAGVAVAARSTTVLSRGRTAPVVG